MRKALVVVLGLASLGIFVNLQFALAEKYDEAKRCHDMGEDCASGRDGRTLFCLQLEISCNAYNADHGYQDPSDPNRPGSKITGGQVTNPRPGGGGSRRIGGTLKTADGRTLIPMMTPPPENKKWFWNGEYNYNIVVINRAGYQEIISVMQGDPDCSLTRYVDGKLYNVADPEYPKAVADAQAKAAGAKSGTKVHYHVPAGPVSNGVATFNAPSQPAPVAGSGAVGSGANANAHKTPALQRQNAVGTVMGPAGIFGADRPKLHAN
jgi:hypothetical protein